MRAMEGRLFNGLIIFIVVTGIGAKGWFVWSTLLTDQPGADTPRD
jgi:hypothetical protein